MTRVEEVREAVQEGKLTEPFSKKNLERVFKNWGKGTYDAYLFKHRVGNPGGYLEYFERVAPGKFKLVK